MDISPFAGKLPEPSDLVDIPKLIQAYETQQPDPSIPAQQVQFGTSGHRGSSLDCSFNQNHILAITQAVCQYREKTGISGPIFLGLDTHALSVPAFHSTLEVLAANEVTVFIAPEHEFTPTPVISHAILTFNHDRKERLADGIVLSPSHNPPGEGGFKYNPTHGGPAGKEITDWIQNQANRLLKEKLVGVKRLPFERALNAATTRQHDYLHPYVTDLKNVIDMDVIRDSKIRIGVDPLGGAGVHYWPVIAEHYGIELSVTNPKIDPSFRFMTRDWDGQIRMDPSSPYAMQGALEKARRFDIAFACDTDHDRHGIVTPNEGLMQPNHYLAVAIDYLYRHRPLWPSTLKVGKTLVSSQMIDRVATALGRELYEVPVGFKWFVDGLMSGSLGFGGEESAGATFLRKNAQVWTTDKDGMIPGLLAAEMTAKLGKNPAAIYQELSQTLGSPIYRRIEAPANVEQKKKLSKISKAQVGATTLAGQPIEQILTEAPGNHATIGGVKVVIKDGWFAARPSGTEDIYKIYGESFSGREHLDLILKDAQEIVDATF